VSVVVTKWIPYVLSQSIILDLIAFKRKSLQI